MIYIWHFNDFIIFDFDFSGSTDDLHLTLILVEVLMTGKWLLSRETLQVKISPLSLYEGWKADNNKEYFSLVKVKSIHLHFG